MKYKVTVETLAPLHIGSGAELLANYDYKALESGNVTYVFNQDAVYASELAQRGAKADLAQPAASLVKDLANPPGEFIRYKLTGQARLERLHEQMKDVYGGVYLPGSSLKGAIRNALMTYAASQRDLSARNLDDNPKEAARKWEQDIFGASPWNDILRALQIADSQPVNPPPLEVLPVRVFVSAEDDEGSPIEVEAISSWTVFETSINLDELILQYADDPRLDWLDRRALLANLLPVLQEVGKRRTESELAIARERGFRQVSAFYEDLQAKAGSAGYQNAALLQIGWGTGWEGMTIGEVLDKPLVDHLRRKYELGKPPGWNEKEKGPWQPNLDKPFPKSHRFSGDKMPQKPPGWVKITLTPEGQPRLERTWDALQAIAAHGIEPMGEFATVRDLRLGRAEKPARPTSQPSGMIWLFSPDRLPQPGDTFQARTLTDGEKFFISLPGLDFETQAYGVLFATDNPNLIGLENEPMVRAEVLEGQKDAGGVLRVRCKVVKIL